MLYADRIRRQIQALGNIPAPSSDAIDHSEKLYQHIKQQLIAQPLSFHDVMEQLLYAPGLGYYSAGAAKIGASGDFITAPEISPYFGYALARQCAQILSESCASILEIGAGLGTMARDILQQLEIDNNLPEHYYILEISADLRQRQQSLLKQQIPHLYSKFIWLEELPETPFEGVIIANEVIDAMPVHLFEMTATGATEIQVALSEMDELTFHQSGFISESLQQWFSREAIKNIEFTEGYCSEVNLMMESWMTGLAKFLKRGLILIIDYGYPRHEYYLPERSQGTLLSYYRHHSHDQVLFLAGLQDITAHVDFTAVAETASDAGLSVAGYTNQASFLSGCGILQMAEQAVAGDIEKQYKIAQQIRTLLMPEEMGELFKVMALTKDLAVDISSQLSGFSYSDLRHHL
jgi:SAM-dependent MidA family methyltransferase